MPSGAWGFKSPLGHAFAPHVSGGFLRSVNRTSTAQHVLHRPSLCERVDKFVEVAHLPHERILDVLHPDPAHRARDQRGLRIEGRLREELLERRAVGEVAAQGGLVEAGQPFHYLIQFGDRAALLLHLRDVVGIDGRDAHRVDPVHGSAPYSRSRSLDAVRMPG